ncbi:MAG: hypothetical protein WCF95_07545, partial [bacterium]
MIDGTRASPRTTAKVLAGRSGRVLPSTSTRPGLAQRARQDRLLARRLDPDGASLDRYNPTAHWKVELREKDLLEKLGQRAGIKRVDALELPHDPQGRVLELVVREGKRAHRFTGMRIRNL